MESYIDRIKTLKSQKKLTNERLAELSGIPLGTLSKMLAGMNDSPKLSNIVAICGALDCSVEYIVTGAPENNNNALLSVEELRLIDSYRKLDHWGQELLTVVTERELARATAPETPAVDTAEEPKRAKILKPVLPSANRYASRYAGEKLRTEKRTLQLYDLPVSAGTGVYLDAASSESIRLPDSQKTREADYALRISGDSMEPKYHNGDILLVQSADSIESGEAGIFLLDGSAFFKIYGGDRLFSLNPTYGPILLKDFSRIECKGRVLGRVKRKT